MPPAILESSQMRTSSERPRVITDWDFLNRETRLNYPDQHLRSKLHARTLQVQLFDPPLPKRAETAIQIRKMCVEEYSEKPVEYGCAKEAVEQRHGFSTHPTRKTIPNYEVHTLLKQFDKLRDFVEVISLVSISHNDQRSAGFADPPQSGASVASFCVQNKPRPSAFG